MKKSRILIFVVAFNAEEHIAKTLERISEEVLRSWNYEILIIDDASNDKTYAKCEEFLERKNSWDIKLRKNTHNLGYGGNQKLGYNYAIENQFDIVVLLHGDGQYAPEYLDQMVKPILTQDYQVVLGSRMLDKKSALKGGMPMYKWIGNQILTQFQNLVLRTNLSEFHTGYRAYSVKSLVGIPFNENSDYFDFDTEILIQLIDQRNKFKEISIPTFYGDEISYVNGIKYAWLIIASTCMSRIVKKGILRDKRFSYNRLS